MKVHCGEISFPDDKSKYSRLIVKNETKVYPMEAWCYLTKAQARRLGERLIKWADRKEV